MNALQQHMLDSYRAAQRGEQPPPPPGRHDRSVLRAVRDHFRRSRRGNGSVRPDGRQSDDRT
ncbi:MULTISPECIES: hypothetical protein [unclassified Streptomyces]|uniref:hypothetical protein n=1 Tax=unclassified Streptomyces TaxID=2593676 RepID=UPI0033C3FF4A